MGYIRFFRRLRILPYTDLNFSKSGVSISFGPRGLGMTIGRHGIRFTAGIPGTGVFYTHHISKKWFKKSTDNNEHPSKDKRTAVAPETIDGGEMGETWEGIIGIALILVAAIVFIKAPVVIIGLFWLFYFIQNYAVNKQGRQNSAVFDLNADDRLRMKTISRTLAEISRTIEQIETHNQNVSQEISALGNEINQIEQKMLNVKRETQSNIDALFREGQEEGYRISNDGDFDERSHRGKELNQQIIDLQTQKEAACSALLAQISRKKRGRDQLSDQLKERRRNIKSQKESMKTYETELANLKTKPCRQWRNYVNALKTEKSLKIAFFSSLGAANFFILFLTENFFGDILKLNLLPGFFETSLSSKSTYLLGIGSSAVGIAVYCFFRYKFKMNLGNIPAEPGEVSIEDVEKTAEPADSSKTIVTPDSLDEKQQFFFSALFSMLAKLTKCDGRITKAEIQAVEHFMENDLQLDAHTRKYAIDIFRSVTKSGYMLQEYAVQFNGAFQQDHFIILLVMDILIQVSMADGIHSSIEREQLESVRHIFGIDERAYMMLKAAYLNTPDRYYTLLGCRKEDDLDLIKARYRDLVKEYHPDLLKSKGLPNDFVGFANRKISLINDAYDILSSDSTLIGE